ncbi:hypothetical protein ACFSKU_19185 [Pontibacter silvestris]|uniref:Uncharacterized protein n=1 Tax=Pontibacter silvestris TaxID=2305183 RepID=A0ABW4X4E9_9BACT|nr:hypothetical protein [Pontibacter silvestris]MCC9134984.1 hypothetical protein [Pontibacter silvestris]
MEFLKRIKDRAPEYDASFEEIILDFTLEQGGKMGTSTEADKWTKGKYFSTKYEIYMYAALLGLKTNYSLPISYGTEKKKFIEMRSWQPMEITDFVIMAVLAKSDIDFNELENLEEKEIEKKLTEMKSILESYANGGFDMIRAKRDADPAFFLQNENCFLDFLEQ